MKPIKKQIVTDESMNPVAVLIDYQDWQEIEKILETYQQQDTTPSLASYAGTINLTIAPLAYQQEIRNEWL
ncbi:hypothetical protein Sta7437_2515 [Stanieria cyanosphaera PCC 7437]|uniref:Uncharacterized protein n=1 Tax=Stanieria cyanosphaera (strain ATCC 29371 / PCC 7437) TaxID=111780 RepID=K9XU13_STAC7|nr:hypothetical protein [Stanieria cyanosphaera]AFZ36048.1 hypothetical protein Sta7437_2515 [Stanieria cyanosphaera PCC 7437]